MQELTSPFTSLLTLSNTSPSIKLGGLLVLFPSKDICTSLMSCFASMKTNHEQEYFKDHRSTFKVLKMKYCLCLFYFTLSFLIIG